VATYKQFRLGDVASAQAGFGLIGPDCRSFNLLAGQRRVPPLSIVYPTEAEPRPRVTRSQQLWPRPSRWSRRRTRRARHPGP
jgi:hypothetical protein